MSVRIENYCQKEIPDKIENIINNCLKKVPPEHLIGLDSIVIVNKVSQVRYKDRGGLYWPKNGRNPAKIEIAIDEIFKGMPKFMFFLPFIIKFMLANVLYHEIGHHYQKFTHELKKEKWENFAETYRKKMIRKTFFWWLILFLPFKSLINNHIKNKKN